MEAPERREATTTTEDQARDGVPVADFPPPNFLATPLIFVLSSPLSCQIPNFDLLFTSFLILLCGLWKGPWTWFLRPALPLIYHLHPLIVSITSPPNISSPSFMPWPVHIQWYKYLNLKTKETNKCTIHKENANPVINARRLHDVYSVESGSTGRWSRHERSISIILLLTRLQLL
jgi:hypothetical protein